MRPPYPFSLRGAPNVFLETIKRGELDDFTSKAAGHPKTVILRLYEAFGGHARATLNIADHVSVRRAYVTNLLEDETETLRVMRADDEASDPSSGGPAVIHLHFHAFEVKTVKLEIESVNVSDEDG